MAIKKEKPKALTLVKGDFITSLQNVMDQGNLLVAVLDAAMGNAAINAKVRDMIAERLKAFREALYGGEG